MLVPNMRRIGFHNQVGLSMTWRGTGSKIHCPLFTYRVGRTGRSSSRRRGKGDSTHFSGSSHSALLWQVRQVGKGVVPTALGPRQVGLPLPGSDLEHRTVVLSMDPTDTIAVTGVSVCVLAPQSVLRHRDMRPPSRGVLVPTCK